MADGIIWSAGKHHVFVNNKPASVYASKDTIQDTFNVFQDEIKRNGGITLGIDHIPEETLKSFPILKKLDILNVGKITKIGHDGKRIFAIESEHTNPLIAELYSEGELPAYSIVADFEAHKCPNGQSDYVLDKIKSIKRTDYVDEGGCQACKTGIQPDDMIMTAKLSMEEETMAKPETQENPAPDTQETPDAESEEAGATMDDCMSAISALSDQIGQLIGLLQEDIQEDSEEDAEDEKEDAEEQKVQASNSIEARLAKLEKEKEDLVIEAKTSVYMVHATRAVEEAKITPVLAEGLVKSAIVEGKTEEDFKTMLASLPVNPELAKLLEQDSKHVEAGKPKKYTKEQFLEDYERAYGKKPE